MCFKHIGTDIFVWLLAYLLFFCGGRVGGWGGAAIRHLLFIPVYHNRPTQICNVIHSLQASKPAPSPSHRIPVNLSEGAQHRLHMELDLQSLFGLLCTVVVLIGGDPTIPPHPYLGLYTRVLLVSQKRRHLFVTPWGTDFSNERSTYRCVSCLSCTD
jgi:hypothetical protein